MHLNVIIKNLIFLFLVMIAGAISIFGINNHINKNRTNMCSLENTPMQAALVLGARVWSNGEMSDIFKDRVKTAINLYKENKINKILVSGDHGSVGYNEVGAAKKYLLENSIPKEDIFLDHAGFDTYDSVYRARDIFEAKSLVIVTQNFHLPRALYIAKALGVSACGVSADLQQHIGEDKRNKREIFANIKAWLNVVLRSKPKYLGDHIPLSKNGTLSWD